LLKVKNDLHFNSSQSTQLLNDVVSKVNSLETSLAREEQMRSDLKAKLNKSEEQNLELSNFIKSLQNQSE